MLRSWKSWLPAGLVLVVVAFLVPVFGQEDDERERQVMERFLTLLEKSPKRSTALDRVFGYHVERGTLDTLIKGYQERTARDAKDGASWLVLGLLEAQRGRDAAAVAAFRSAEAARPDDPLAPYYLGQALVLVGQPDTAAEAFERALARKPARTDLMEIFQALGRVHQRARHTEQALAIWGRLEALFPDDLRVQEQIAATLVEESEPARALPRFEALAKKTTDPYRKVQYRMDADDLKVRLNRQAEALMDLEGLLGELNLDSWLYREARRRIEEVFLRNDDQAGLATYYEKWLQKTPEDVEAMARLGRTLAGLGRAAEARGWFDKAVKLAPSRKELRLALVEQLVQEKKVGAAAAQYEAMAKSDPNNPDLIRDWGRLLLKDESKPEADRTQAAAAVWRKLVEARPADAATAVLVADLFRQAEMPDEAIALYQKAIALAPDSPQHYEYLGEYYHTLKRSKDAREVWAQLAAGKNRTAKNLGRLAEVLAGFGYAKEALGPIADACKLDPDAFDFQLKYAALLFQAERYPDTLAQLEAAAKAADDPEQSEAVLDLRIKTYQASGKLADQIAVLRKELDAGGDAERFRRLARYSEADQKLPEASTAIGKAVALDKKSVPGWSAYARIHEATGDFGGAADAYRALAGLDRRARTEYLTQVAKLEVRLGRKDRALQAGRDVLAAAPGNPESYEFFADLCAQLGATEEGLSALRRAVRVNPSDSKALLTLAEALAKEFRTEEAIELYWRAFEKTTDIDGKLGIVSRLTDLYLQRNQFDRLVGRLEREGREAKQPRELAICLAQAYLASGDYGAARSEWERLLAGNPRDTVLLQQLSSLAETDGDLAAASKYQRQLNDLAPTDDGSARLAQLYLRAGEATEAEAIWARMAGGKQELVRVLQTIDNLLTHDKAQTVLGITERVLRDQPGQWEALYREGAALAKLEKFEDADRRFRSILSQHLGDDELCSSLKEQEKKQAGRPAGTKVAARSRRFQPLQHRHRLQERVGAVWQVRQATGLQGHEDYQSGRPALWTPSDFGEARLASLGWLLSSAQKRNKLDDVVKEFSAVKDQAPRDLRRLWDWYYLTAVNQNNKDQHESARVLSKVAATDPAALWAYLSALSSRSSDEANQNARAEDGNTVDKTPPLAPDEIKEMMTCFRTLEQRQPDWVDASVLAEVSTELKRAKRTDEADALFREIVAKAQDPTLRGAAIALATRRGDVDTLLDLLEREANAQAGASLQGSGLDGHVDALMNVMSARADAKAHADVFKLFDRYFDWFAQPDQVAQRLRAFNARGSGPQQNNVQFYLSLGKAQRWVNLDYPTPNRYFDNSALQMLRTAYEIFKRDDLLSDLFAHVRKRAEQTPEAARVLPLLALGYLDWWNDDKDEAVRELTRAADAAKNDPELRLGLAEIRSKRGEQDEALALVDSVEPMDQKTMQRREVLALRLAVLTGNVDRARLASERLFNLRLDTETQVQLAAQMHQLGMHDLAEAVLARARRRAGNNSNTLVGLMQQYQQQNKMDVAVQVAHQILRTAMGRQNNPNNDNEDAAQREAIQVLARSGKLDELIGRVETQLKTSPNSVQLLQTLADYFRAAGNKEKANATIDRIIKLRPDDAKLGFQLGMQLLHAGDTEAALPHLKTAITKEPSLFGNRYWEIENAFEQAGKGDDLAAIFENVDVKKLGNFWSLEQLVTRLMRTEKTRERGLKLFRKLWAAFPAERGSMIAQFYDEEVWKLPEMYNFAREAVIPAPTQKQVSRWSGIDKINSWSGGGHVNGVATHLLDAAARQNKLDVLRSEIEEAVKRVPEWTGGKAFLALIQVRKNRLDEAKKAVEGLMANDVKDKDPIPYASKLFLAQEIENFGPLEPLALALYEKANKEESEGRTDFEWNPVRRLIALYKKLGRVGEARDLVLKWAKRPDTNNYGDPSYAAYQRIQATASIGRELLELGYPADAVPLFNEALSDTDALQAVQRMYGGDENNYIVSQLREGLNNGLSGLNEKTLPRTVRTLLKPGNGAGGEALNLVLLVHPRTLDRAAVTSLFAEATRAAARDPALRAEVKSTLDDLIAKHPQDLSVQVASALLAATEEKPAALAEASDRLVKLTDESPLDDLSAGARANARQRAEAARQLGLWLIARECWTHEETRDAGDALAARALEAARRQADPMWSLAMLREWGQLALDRKDQASAERHWSRMLDLVLSQGSASKPDPARKTAGPATTLERFDLAAQVAKLTAEHGMVPLALRAVRAALSGGPPAVPMPIDANNGGMIVTRRTNDQTGQTDRRVEEQLGALHLLWQRRQAPAAEVYEVLRDAVLPEARPTEVFIYPRPLAQSVRNPQSVGALLAEWAVAAGRTDDLRKRLATRQGQALAEVDAQVLLAQVGLAAKDWTRAGQALQALDQRLQKDTLQTSALQAALAALPALDHPETSAPAVTVLERAVKALSDGNSEEPRSGLYLALAHAHFASGQTDAGRKDLREYQDVQLKSVPNYGGDYSLRVRKERLQRVAAESARAGQWGDTLDVLGQFVDAPAYSGGDPGLGIVVTMLARQFASQPALERYERLKAWTLPAANRQSVRLLATFVPEDAPPALFGTFPTSSFDSGVASTAGMLVTAAKEAGTLDALAGETATLVEQKVENAEALDTLVQIARQRGRTLRPRLVQKLGELKEVAIKEQDRRKPILWSDVLVARACLNDPELERNPGEGLARALISQSQRTQNWPFLGHMRRDLAVSLARRAGDSTNRQGGDPGLAYWTPASTVEANQHAAGSPPAWWVESEGHIKHICGPQDQYLLFNYPLSGRFEFSVDAFIGGWAEGHAGYGGLVFEANAANVNSNVFSVGRGDYVARPSKFVVGDAFNRMTVQVEPGKVRCLVNGHLFYEDDDPGPTAPWLALLGTRERQTTFRNLTLTGSPQIPRELPLTRGDRLEGWVSNFLSQSQPPRRSLDPSDPKRQALAAGSGLDDYDWSAFDGVVRGRRGAPIAVNQAVQSRLYYYRPVRDGESIAYEFYYEPDAVMVHPALDRLTFLLGPDGVRLHWIIDGLDEEWTGLKPGNAVPAPDGPATLALKPRAWNAAKVSIQGDSAVIELNGTEVYRRTLEPDNSRQFGFFHFRDRTAARARNVVLKGDWPESVPPEALADPAARREHKPETARERRAAHDLIDEDILCRASWPVLKAARGLPAEKRYESLTRWVLPDEGRDEFRLYGDFTPTDAAPPVAFPAIVPPDNLAEIRLHTGGQLDAPVLELVAVAKRLGKLDALAERVQEIEPVGEHALRGQVALLALIHMAQRRDNDANAELRQLNTLVKAMDTQTPIRLRWPEQVAHWASLGKAPLRPASRDLGAAIIDHWHYMNGHGIYPRDRDLWGHQMMYAFMRGHLFDMPMAQRNASEPAVALPLWSRAEHASAQSRGRGKPVPRWYVHDQGVLTHGQGHHEDFMYLNIPLRGDFVLDCEIQASGANQVQLLYGALMTGTRWDRKVLEVTQFGKPKRDLPIEPPLPEKHYDFFPFRLVVKDRTYTTYFDGRKVFEDTLPAQADPWLAVHQAVQGNTGVRNLKITGSPTVPTVVELSSAPDLAGWLADYYEEPVSGENPAWEKKGEEIVGRNFGATGPPPVDRYGNTDTGRVAATSLPGSKQESLLQYHRPLFEDGEVAYEFFHDPGKVHVAPVLDRLTFLLDPEGVKVHWLTDAQFDRTGLAPDNVTVEEKCRRSPGKLPLKANDWNRLTLSLAGDVVTLALNGEAIYERPLEATNNRQFGLFHFADETEARVRHVTHRGRWPTEWPQDVWVGNAAGRSASAN